MEKKHAYLIMAHEDDYTLKKLLSCLDYEVNDIFLHIDKKNNTFNISDLEKCVAKSRINIYKEYSVYWGTQSQVKCELFLIQKAISTDKYQYLHLISGADLPIKSQDQIYDFFSQHQGKEFIHYDDEFYREAKQKRCRRYYFFREKRMKYSSVPLIGAFFSRLDSISLNIQDKLNVDRRRGMEIYSGANWFSITSELAHYLIEKKSDILKLTKYSISGDEVFLQTIVAHSKFIHNCYLYPNADSNCYAGCVREIDWKRGKPYVYRMEDYEQLISSGSMFARKFNSHIDKNIIDAIVKVLLYRERG